MRDTTTIPFRLLGLALEACEDAYGDRWQGVTFTHDSGGFARVHETDEHVVLAYRGTDQARDWLGNLRAYPWKNGGAWVHRGFQCGHAALWPSVYTELQRRLEHSQKPVIVTGHSLGGALAELSCLFLRNYPGSVSLFTFGKPNVFFSPKTTKLAMLTHQVSVVSGTDGVARLPALMFGPDPGQTMLYLATKDDRDYWIPQMTDANRAAINADCVLGGVKEHHSIVEYRKRYDRLVTEPRCEALVA